MDYEGGVLTSAGVELIRKMEVSSLPVTKQNNYSRAILPSKAAITLAARKLELSAQDILPFEMFTTASGEGVKFTKLSNFIQTILRAHGLHETAKRRRVEIGISIDAAPITKTLSHVTMMLTLIDASDMDPRTKIPYFLRGTAI
jgi:hypothetical protein